MRSHERSKGWVRTSRQEGWVDFVREGVPPEGCRGGEDPMKAKALLLRLKVYQERVKV